MPVLNPCDNCGTPTPIYRLAALVLDGRVARLCPRCVSSQQERIDTPYAPRTDGGANQPSTTREVW